MSAPQEEAIPVSPADRLRQPGGYTNAQQAQIELTASELAELIWFMVQIKQSFQDSEVDPVSSPVVIDDSQPVSLPFGTTKPPSIEPISTSAPIYPEPASITISLPIKIADPLALRNALDLGRSLRPLMRKVPSLTETVLDEEATVTSIAEVEELGFGFWLPVFHPLPSRWLEVALVVEETPRYPLWRQTLTEFQQLLERHGAFRNVSLWYLKIGSQGRVELYSKTRQASFKELRDPSGKRLIWVVSDCVSAIWHDGSLFKILRDWGTVQPVSLLQLLPERLWSRTALGWGIETQLYAENPGVPNSRLLKDIPITESSALTLPVVTLEPFPLKNWAKVLAGVGVSRTAGLVFLPEEITPQVSDGDLKMEKLSAQARVNRFRAASSPLARDLARMMAAVPLCLPVIRLIQKNLLPNSHTVHVAEVLMGGLLKPTAEGETAEVNYEFYPGVREELIKITPKSKTVDVIVCLSEFVDRQLRLKGSVRNFEAILFDPDIEIELDYLPFARITAQTLQLLGGKYAEMAEQIQQKMERNQSGQQLITDEQLTNPVKVFISYSHDSQEHSDLVLSLSDRLRDDGVDCHIDQYETSPSQGWARWMVDKLDWADFVLIICTETYNRRFRGHEKPKKGRGVTWEGAIISQDLYDAYVKSTKFIPIIFSAEDYEHIPLVIRVFTHYKLVDKEGYETLYRRLTNQPETPPPFIAKLKELQPKQRNPGKQPLSTVRFCNLPHRAYRKLIGRSQEIKKILKFISPNYRNHISVVTGSAGIGKTTLVLEVAYRCLEASENPSLYPDIPKFDAIIFTLGKATDLVVERSAKELTLHHILRVIAYTLNEQSINQVAASKQISLVNKILARQSTLLMVDGLDTLTPSDQRGVLNFLNNVPAPTKVIITTRQNIGFNSIHLGHLSLKESSTLIDTEAKSKKIIVSERWKKALYREYNGIPLALIYAVGQRVAGYDWSDILKPREAIDEYLGKFCFESSVKPLRGKPAHRLLIATTFFRDSSCKDALVTVAGLVHGSQEVRHGLATLQRLSLVGEENGRYFVLSFTREQALHEFENHTDPNFRENSQERWLNWYLEFTKKYGGEDWENWRSRYDKLEEEWRNIESVLYWYAAQSNWQKVLELWEQIDNYVDLNRYWDKRRHWWEQISQKFTDVGVKVKALSEKAWTLVLMGHEYYSEAEQCLDRAWELHNATPLVVQADIANHFAVLEKGREKYDLAQEWLNREKEILDNCQLPDRQKIRHQIQNLYYQAELNQLLDRKDIAKKQFEKVIELCEQVKWERFRNYAQNNLADILIEENNLAQAETILHQGLFFAESTEERRRVALYHASYARLYYKLAEHPDVQSVSTVKFEYLTKAKQYAEEALSVFEKEWMVEEQKQIEELKEAIDNQIEELEKNNE